MMPASQLTCGLATGHGTSHNLSSDNDVVLCGDDAHSHWSVSDDIVSLLERTPVRSLLQHNSKFLMVQSSVSLVVCLQAMIEYEFTYVLVYDPAVYEIIGYLDDRFFLHLFAVKGLGCLHKSCKELLDLESDTTVCKVDEHMSARDAAPLMRNQRYVLHQELDVPLHLSFDACEWWITSTIPLLLSHAFEQGNLDWLHRLTPLLIYVIIPSDKRMIAIVSLSLVNHIITPVFSSKRLFVWSAEKDVPIGFLTPSCYLGYISKHLHSCVGGLHGIFEDVTSSPDRPTVSEDCTLQEVTDLLIDHDTVLVGSANGQVICVLNCSIIVQYLLSVLRGKEPFKLSTPIRVVINHFDALPDPRPVLPEVKESELLKDELDQLLYSRGGAVLCVECRMDYSRVVTVWDVLCHVLPSFV